MLFILADEMREPMRRIHLKLPIHNNVTKNQGRKKARKKKQKNAIWTHLIVMQRFSPFFYFVFGCICSLLLFKHQCNFKLVSRRQFRSASFKCIWAQTWAAETYFRIGEHCFRLVIIKRVLRSKLFFARIVWV